MKTKLSLAVIAILSITTMQAFAQDAVTGSTTAEGTVLAPISFDNTTILNFGIEIFPGIDKSVARTEATAAQFDISGEPTKEVTADFTLPTDLTHTGDGVTTMPIAFGTDDAGHATASTDQGAATGYDPSSTLTTTLEATSGELYIWLGGTVQPANNQASGAYSGDITLDVAYTGQ